MRDTQQVREWLLLQRGRRGAIAKLLAINPKTLERIAHSLDYFPRADTLEKIDRFISAEEPVVGKPLEGTCGSMIGT